VGYVRLDSTARKRGQAAISELTEELIARSRIIAKGRRIRDLDRLLKDYGGRASAWVKKSSPPVEIGGHLYEYHWYEHHGLGRFEIKRKRVSKS
jgi:hypothetical protein